MDIVMRTCIVLLDAGHCNHIGGGFMLVLDRKDGGVRPKFLKQTWKFIMSDRLH